MQTETIVFLAVALLLGLVMGAMIAYFMAKKQVAEAKAEAKAHAEGEEGRISQRLETAKQNWQEQQENLLKMKDERYQQTIQDNANATEELKAQHAQAIETLKEQYAKATEELKAQHEKAMSDKESYHKEMEEKMAGHFNELKAQYELAVKQLQEQQEKENKSRDERFKSDIDKQQKLFDEVIGRVQAEMKTATADLLKERQKEFSETSKANIDNIITPLQKTISEMKMVINENTTKQTELGATMKVKIEEMINQSASAKESADELVRVFKHTGKVQGDWGETILNELLTMQGLTKGVHYEVQEPIRDNAGNIIRTEEGKTMRPDVILHLDQKRDVVIDAKVSLTAYLDYVNEEDPNKKAMYLKKHIESVKAHYKELSKKDYSAYIIPPKVKMDYVIMFVPNAGALTTVLQEEPNLWREAMQKNVFIADEQTLYAALKIIQLTWTQIVQQESQTEVFNLANEMLERVGEFLSCYNKVGDSLRSAQEAFGDGYKKLKEGGQSIPTTCKKLIKLGAKPKSKERKNALSQYITQPEALALPSDNEEDLK